MKRPKIGIIILTSVMLIGLVLGGIVMAQSLLGEKSFDKAKYVQDEIIVKFKEDVKPFRVIKVPQGRVGEKIKEYLARKDILYAEPNFIAYTHTVPNDPLYSYQWNLNNSVSGGIQMEKAWDIQAGDHNVVVAVIDTGVAYENYSTGRRGREKKYYQAPDLANTIFVAGYDFVENDSHPNDDNSHGTHVAGTIAQSTNNNEGVAGVAFNTTIMPVKVLDKNGSGTYADVAEGIIWVTDHGAKVINLSLGGNSPSKTLENAVAYAYTNGVTVIVSAGNDGSDSISYPAAYDDYVIAVGATRYDETLAYYSNYGSSLDLTAPGGDLDVDQNGDGYGDGVLQNTFNPNTKITNDFGYWFFQGTSMAAPHVSGVAALLIANGNATTPDEIRAVLQETAKDLGVPGKDNTYGYGLIDAFAALSWTAGPECLEGETKQCGETEVGECKYGTQTCSAEGVWGECVGVVSPADEECDGLDNDCDGIVDQITRQCGTVDVGACQYGTQICTAGVWEECVDAIEPTTEVCNGLDDDCDGVLPLDEIDEDADGYMTCQDDCDDSNAAINPGVTEICDGIDNNCNGEIDEGGVCEVPTTEPFTFSGTVPKGEELGHGVSVSSPGAASMDVKLTWSGWDDLRLRVYNPEGVMVKEVDNSTWRNKVEETTIYDLESGDWTVAVYSESRRSSVNYTIEGVVNY